MNSESGGILQLGEINKWVNGEKEVGKKKIYK